MSHIFSSVNSLFLQVSVYSGGGQWNEKRRVLSENPSCYLCYSLIKAYFYIFKRPQHLGTSCHFAFFFLAASVLLKDKHPAGEGGCSSGAVSLLQCLVGQHPDQPSRASPRGVLRSAAPQSQAVHGGPALRHGQWHWAHGMWQHTTGQQRQPNDLQMSAGPFKMSPRILLKFQAWVKFISRGFILVSQDFNHPFDWNAWNRRFKIAE